MNLDGMGINSRGFWGALIVGVLLVLPLTHTRARWVAIAALNLGFLFWIQRSWIVVTIVLLAASYVTVCVIAKSRSSRSLAYGGALVFTLALFVAYKAPSLARLVPAQATSWLATLGFSYLALRFIDELGAVRDRAEAPSLLDHINYLIPFHMLIAGPIQRYDDFLKQPRLPSALTSSEAFGAVERIAVGLFKKLVVAHVIERIFLTDFRSTGLYYVLEVQLFLLWLYLDFSSYSDIAVGTGRLLGIRTPENFDRPYLARDMVEFWQRWHISLSEWIKRNVFMPMQLHLQRRDTGLSVLVSSSITVLVAFGLCGLWHMVSVRYALWGLMHAGGVIAANWSRARLMRKLGRAGYESYRKKKIPRWIGIVLTFEFVAWSLAVAVGK